MAATKCTKKRREICMGLDHGLAWGFISQKGILSPTVKQKADVYWRVWCVCACACMCRVSIRESVSCRLQG